MKTGQINLPWIKHEETFDDYYALIKGENSQYRLLIFKGRLVVYIADADRKIGLRRLKNQIGEFRYGFTNNEYDQL